MPLALLSGRILATFSKHDIAGTIVIVIGALALVLGLARAAIRTAMLFGGVVIILIGILFFTRTL